MDKKTTIMLIDYCKLKNIPFSWLDKEERNIVRDTLGFQLFKLSTILKSLIHEIRNSVTVTRRSHKPK